MIVVSPVAECQKGERSEKTSWLAVNEANDEDVIQ